jgi:hypothetical protein
MIWVLFVLALNLPEGPIHPDWISGRVFQSQAECVAARDRFDRWLTSMNTVLNVVCVEFDNIPPDARNRRRS